MFTMHDIVIIYAHSRKEINSLMKDRSGTKGVHRRPGPKALVIERVAVLQ